MRAWVVKGLAVLTLSIGLAGAVFAQDTLVQSQVLTIDSEEVFIHSEFGQRFASEFETKGKALEAENRRIEAELIAEEKELTERRSSLSPDAFRTLADAFDEKVERIRAEQNAKSRALTQTNDTARRQFLIAAQPVLEQIMVEARAAIIVENRWVFLSARSIDITDLAIARLNAEIGDGSTLPELAQPDER